MDGKYGKGGTTAITSKRFFYVFYVLEAAGSPVTGKPLEVNDAVVAWVVLAPDLVAESAVPVRVIAIAATLVGKGARGREK